MLLFLGQEITRDESTKVVSKVTSEAVPLEYILLKGCLKNTLRKFPELAFEEIIEKNLEEITVGILEQLSKELLTILLEDLLNLFWQELKNYSKKLLHDFSTKFLNSRNLFPKTVPFDFLN